MKKKYEATYYFVLNGYINGTEASGMAITAGHGVQQPDGWYFLFDNGMTDGVGPFKTKELAAAAARPGILAQFAEEEQSSFSLVLEELFKKAKDAGLTSQEAEDAIQDTFNVALHYVGEDVYEEE